MSQASYARIESGTIILKIDRLQRIAEILAVNQSGYVNNHTNNTIDIEVIRAIIREDLP
ncbi:hypothetical protein AGMMS49965_12890 [Bacteroidia bacterium]|nr:hypothetical protein AGMMS49965_12890 [Bacteroidia bacterium]